jgi:pyruvate formate lyase activating enzyme
MEVFQRARWWTREGSYVKCDLCPHLCWLEDHDLGICGVRKNIGMQLFTLNYGKVCVATVDSIEKKPIFHYRPGSKLYSVGTAGCNLECASCQNYELAKGVIGHIPYTSMTPEAIVGEAIAKGADGLGWTFNEPVVWSEFVVDASVEAKKKGLYSMINTNGFIQKGAREDLLSAIDVMKIDVKAFSDEFYRSICNGMLDPVLETCTVARERGVHVELAYLMVPGMNDSDVELKAFATWARDSMGPDVPVHLFRFSPEYKLLQLPKESMERMRQAREIAKSAGIHYVYIGGVIAADEQNTYCPSCGELIVSRRGEEPSEKLFVKGDQMSKFCPSFSDIVVRAEGGRCPKCGEEIKIKFA